MQADPGGGRVFVWGERRGVGRADYQCFSFISRIVSCSALCRRKELQRKVVSFERARGGNGENGNNATRPRVHSIACSSQ